MKTIKGFQINNTELNHWEKLFKQWQSLIERYCKIMEEDDAPFYHTERANIGVLAGAAWKTGWLALEEFIFRKRAWIFPSHSRLLRGTGKFKNIIYPGVLLLAKIV
ncbi:MAG: hypothetical protein FJ134_12665 [Deltaproteobacteria bacterium]|nr:hypothetical protein [Deltaproteobacteria bacterium]